MTLQGLSFFPGKEHSTFHSEYRKLWENVIYTLRGIFVYALCIMKLLGVMRCECTVGLISYLLILADRVGQ